MVPEDECEAQLPSLDGTTTVHVPAGVQSGEVIKLKGKGIASLEGYGKGHQLVRVVVETPRKVSGKARNLFEQLRELDGHKSIHPARQGFLDKIQEFLSGLGSRGREDGQS